MRARSDPEPTLGQIGLALAAAVGTTLACSGCSEPTDPLPNGSTGGSNGVEDDNGQSDRDACWGFEPASMESQYAGTFSSNLEGRGCLQGDAVDLGQLDFHNGSGVGLTAALSVDLSRTSISAPSVSLPGDFTNTSFHGAVDPRTDDPWWHCWTYLKAFEAVGPRGANIPGMLPGPSHHPLKAEIESGTLRPANSHRCATMHPSFEDDGFTGVFGASFPVCRIPDLDVDFDIKLTADHIYVLDGLLRVGTGHEDLGGGSPSATATLTLEAGTQVYASTVQAALWITRGSRIEAEGTRARPVILAHWRPGEEDRSGDPTDLSGRGAWNGVVVDGSAVVAGGDDRGQASGRFGGGPYFGFHGGLDHEDDSGTLRYLIIAEGGYNFDTPMPSLYLRGVGRGTEVDHIQVLGADQDCVGLRGGTVDIRHLACSGPDDDGFQLTGGYRGSIQFALVRLGPVASPNGIQAGIQVSTREGEMPVTEPRIANLTVLGNVDSDVRQASGVRHSSGAHGRYDRIVVLDDLLAGRGFHAGCVDVDQRLSPQLRFRDAILGCSPAPLVCDEDAP